MRRTAVFLLLILLALSGTAAASFLGRISASVQAVAAPVLPKGAAWTAVPGPDMPADDPSVRLLVDQTAAQLAATPALSGWKWISNPAKADEADVVVRISWSVGKPGGLREETPLFRPSVGLGVGWGPAPWRRDPFYGAYGGCCSEPYRPVYVRNLVVEASRSAGRSPEAAAPAVPDSGAKPSDDEVLWRVEVSSAGVRSDVRKVLPQLAAAAATAVGKTTRAEVFVGGDMRVSYRLR